MMLRRYENIYLSMIQSRCYPWIIWGLGACLFFSEYFVRTSSSVMVGDLMHAFSVDALGLGALAVCFYYPYTLMQVPVGLLVDRFGPNRLLISMSLVFSLGALLFSVAGSLWVAELARVMMGVSAAFAFVSTLKLATIWFSGARFGYLAGLTQAIGMLGAAVGEGPVAHLVTGFGWRSAMHIMGFIIFGLFLLIAFFMVPSIHVDGHSEKKFMELSHAFKRTAQAVVRNKQTWYNALFAGLIYAPTLAFGELWGVSYLQTVKHFPHQMASTAVSWIFLGWAVGGPIAGRVSDVIKKRKPFFYISCILSMCFMLMILYLPSVTPLQMDVLLFLYGCSNTGLVVCYALSGEINQPHETGTTLALTNMASVLLGTCCQPLIGWFLVRGWDGTMLRGIPVYSEHAYRSAMFALPLIFILAIVSAYFVKETNCLRNNDCNKQEG